MANLLSLRLFLIVLATAVVAAAALPAWSQVALATPAPAEVMGPNWRPSLGGADLAAALRSGGYVLYLRHTSTDFGQNDEAMTSFENCATQRNLTDTGRAEARAIAAALRDLKIPIGDVQASPFCRTLETGRLVFGKATTSSAVRGGPARPDNADRYADLRKLLSTPVAGKTNLAISSHGNPFFGVAGPPYLAEGEMAVVEPQGNGRFRVVARVTKTGWTSLGASQ